MTEQKKSEKGVTRKVTFQAWCHDCVFGWRGKEQAYKSDAAFELACHNVDAHGGSFKGDNQ